MPASLPAVIVLLAIPLLAPATSVAAAAGSVREVAHVRAAADEPGRAGAGLEIVRGRAGAAVRTLRDQAVAAVRTARDRAGAAARTARARAAAVPGTVWGRDGHWIVCQIAWDRLTLEARALVTALIPGEDGLPFVESCIWADEVRRTTHRHTYAYHFINVPAGAAGVDLERDCGDPERRCVTWAVAHYAAVLADADAPPAERREALKFVGHFVGDLHQPLHAGRPDDLGGNRVPVDFFGDTGSPERRLNLHAVWDSHILRRGGVSWPGGAAELGARIEPDEAAEWEDFDVVGWTDESFRLADGYGYGRLPEDGRVRNAYYRPALGHSEVRLQQAGVRLAFLLHHAATNTLEFPEALTAMR